METMLTRSTISRSAHCGCAAHGILPRPTTHARMPTEIPIADPTQPDSALMVFVPPFALENSNQLSASCVMGITYPTSAARLVCEYSSSSSKRLADDRLFRPSPLTC